MVTEMEWKCCHGYSGEDCHDGPKVNPNTRVTQTGFNTGSGQRGEGKEKYNPSSILGTVSNLKNIPLDCCYSEMSVFYIR